jgi:hypothetical protein
MDHLPDHSPDGGGILEPDRPVHPGQAQPAKGPLLRFRAVDPASDQGHFDHLSFHGSLPAFINGTQMKADKRRLVKIFNLLIIFLIRLYLRSSATYK